MPRHCAAVAMETQRIRSVSTSGQQSGASRLKIIPLANLRRPGGADSFSGKPFPLRECESPDRRDETQLPVDSSRDLISPGRRGCYSKCHRRSQAFKSQTFTDAQVGWNINECGHAATCTGLVDPLEGAWTEDFRGQNAVLQRATLR